MNRAFVFGISLALALAGCAAWVGLRSRSTTSWRFAPVERGEVSRQVTATGTLNALTQVAVGTQVSGVVTHLYADFNSLVHEGQIVARIDSAVLETQVAEAKATLRKCQSAWDQAKADLERNRQLAAGSLISAADLQLKVTAFASANGDLEASQAALARARINLGYCTITAPVDGVVVAREVDEGQTVAASFRTPSLFSIAKDLSRMKLQAAVDEADIGQIQAGQEARFTVDSYPGLEFHGAVSEVQLSPTVANNVVTYNVVLAVTNVPRPRLAPARAGGGVSTARYLVPGQPVYGGKWALFPGMTSSVAILAVDHQGVLRVPNLALRFDPGHAETPPGDRVWVLERGVPRALPVTVVVAGARYSEIQGPGIHEGLTVLTGMDDLAPAPAAPGGPGLPPGGPR